MNIYKNKQYILIKNYDDTLEKVGELYEVANILDDCVIICEVATKLAVAAISIKNFDEFFVPFEEAKKKGWTKWRPIYQDDGLIGYYRTNFHKTQFRSPNLKHKATASCLKTDEFNLYDGVMLAYARYRKKIIEETMNKLNIEYDQIQKLEKRMRSEDKS